MTDAPFRTRYNNVMPRRPSRIAFTLLEVILALSLSVIVLAAVGWAIQLHLKALDTRRTDVEEAQLARAVLKMIADDLHSVVAYNTIDFSEAASLASLDIPGSAGGDLEEGDENFELPPEEVEEESDPAEKDLSADLVPGTVPGIFGNQYQLQIDVSRLPRIEDFDSTMQGDANEVRDLPSDVKTVVYYLQPDMGVPEEESQALLAEETTPVTSSTSAGIGWGRGLVRRALDRAATQWAFESGDLSRLDATGEVIAPEIVALEFRYFDGQQWLAAWDSEQSAGLPMAVEVAIAIESNDGRRRDADEREATGGSLTDATSNRDVRVYHQVIRIPSAEPTFEEEAIETDVQ